MGFPYSPRAEASPGRIWRMCVSYRGLNRVTKIFAYPISRCDSSIEDMGDYVGILFFISLDAKQGYHQVKVRE